jgi:hypothetical protein
MRLKYSPKNFSRTSNEDKREKPSNPVLHLLPSVHRQMKDLAIPSAHEYSYSNQFPKKHLEQPA